MRRILWKTLVKEKKKSISKAFIVYDNRTGTFDLKLRVNQELHSHQRFPAVKIMEMLQKYISLDNISNNIANEVVNIYRGDRLGIA